jgi:hypothetical protein
MRVRLRAWMRVRFLVRLALPELISIIAQR